MEEDSTSSFERERLVVGLMSGTSVDAIDAALVRVGPAEGEDRRRVELIAKAETPFDPALRQAIFDLFPPNTGTIARPPPPAARAPPPPPTRTAWGGGFSPRFCCFCSPGRASPPKRWI